MGREHLGSASSLEFTGLGVLKVFSPGAAASVGRCMLGSFEPYKHCLRGGGWQFFQLSYFL